MPESWTIAALLRSARQRGQHPAVVGWTCGTTGPPNGFLLSWRNRGSNVAALRQLDIVGRNDRVLPPLPLHHAYPFVVGTLTPLTIGATILLPAGATGPLLMRALRSRLPGHSGNGVRPPLTRGEAAEVSTIDHAPRGLAPADACPYRGKPQRPRFSSAAAPCPGHPSPWLCGRRRGRRCAASRRGWRDTARGRTAGSCAWSSARTPR